MPTDESMMVRAMQDAAMVTRAMNCARAAHAGQTRRDGRTPYITHPARVAAAVSNLGFRTIAAAWLHDVLEDTNTNVEDLADRYWIPPDVIDAVKVLTKTTGQDYADYITGVRANPIARAVKIADLMDNMSDSPTPEQIAKYTPAIMFLTDTTQDQDEP